MIDFDREDINHYFMQCPACDGIRSEMIDVIKAISDDHVSSFCIIVFFL